LIESGFEIPGFLDPDLPVFRPPVKLPLKLLTFLLLIEPSEMKLFLLLWLFWLIVEEELLACLKPD